MTSETTTVGIEVLAVEPVAGAGRLLALAVVNLVLDGVEVTLQGVNVMRQPDGQLACQVPRWRHPKGNWLPAVVLPPELTKAIADAVFAELGARAAA